MVNQVFGWLGQNHWVIYGVEIVLAVGIIGYIIKNRSQADEQEREINIARYRNGITKEDIGKTLTGEDE